MDHTVIFLYCTATDRITVTVLLYYRCCACVIAVSSHQFNYPSKTFWAPINNSKLDYFVQNSYNKCNRTFWKKNVKKNLYSEQYTFCLSIRLSFRSVHCSTFIWGAWLIDRLTDLTIHRVCSEPEPDRPYSLTEEIACSCKISFQLEVCNCTAKFAPEPVARTDSSSSTANENRPFCTVLNQNLNSRRNVIVP